MILKGTVKAICVGDQNEVAKHLVEEAEILDNVGIEGDANSGIENRQISLVSSEKVQEFGRSGENMVITDIDISNLNIGALIQIGTVVLEITEFGVTATECVFTKVLNGGHIKKNDVVDVIFN